MRVRGARGVVLGQRAEEQLREQPAVRAVVVVELDVRVAPGGQVLCCVRVGGCA